MPVGDDWYLNHKGLAKRMMLRQLLNGLAKRTQHSSQHVAILQTPVPLFLLFPGQVCSAILQTPVPLSPLNGTTFQICSKDKVAPLTGL